MHISLLLLLLYIVCASCVRQTCIRPIPLLTLCPTNIARLKLSGKSPMDMRIPPL